MTTSFPTSEIPALRPRLLLGRMYRSLLRCFARGHCCWVRFWFADSALRVTELEPGDVVRVQAAFSAAGTDPGPADLQDQARRQTGIVVAWLGRSPIGIGYVEWQGPRGASPRLLWPGVPEIHRLWVKPRYRTIGTGAALVRHIEDLTRARGLNRIGLGVHDTNTRAQALYLRLDYQPETQGYLDCYLAPSPGGGPDRQVSHPSTFMIKTLGPYTD